MMEQIPDHPVIQSMERTGYPPGVGAKPRHCEPARQSAFPVGRGLAPGTAPKENGLPRQSADCLAMTEHPDPGAPHGT